MGSMDLEGIFVRLAHAIAAGGSKNVSYWTRFENALRRDFSNPRDSPASELRRLFALAQKSENPEHGNHRWSAGKIADPTGPGGICVGLALIPFGTIVL